MADKANHTDNTDFYGFCHPACPPKFLTAEEGGLVTKDLCLRFFTPTKASEFRMTEEFATQLLIINF